MLESNIIDYSKYAVISSYTQLDSEEIDINIYANDETIFICNENFGNVLVHYCDVRYFKNLSELEQGLLVAYILDLQGVQTSNKNINNLLIQLKNL